VLLMIALLAAAVLGGARSRTPAQPASAELATGAGLYGQYCASCHGANLEGQPNWRSELPGGGRPAPPHDASGHTWHHSDQQLFDMIKYGIAAPGVPPARQMPAFGGQLSDQQIKSVLGFIKSTWPDDIRTAQAQ
jgi:mono/diheme cytochrome c family protein